MDLVILFFVISCSLHIGLSVKEENIEDIISEVHVLLNEFQDSHHDHLSILQDSSLINKFSLIKSIYEENKYLTFFHFDENLAHPYFEYGVQNRK